MAMTNTTPDNLVLRLAVIGGETKPDDYSVWCGPDLVGRIKARTGHPPGTDGWDWHVNPPFPIPPDCTGTARNREEAMAKFKSAWLRFRPSIDDERWERTMARYRK